MQPDRLQSSVDTEIVRLEKAGYREVGRMLMSEGGLCLVSPYGRVIWMDSAAHASVTSKVSDAGSDSPSSMDAVKGSLRRALEKGARRKAAA